MKLNQTLNPISFAERKKINENWEEIVRNIHLLDGKISILAGGDEVDEILARIAKATTDAIKATSDANSATGKANTATSNANSATSKANTAASKADTATTNANNKIVEVNQVLADADIKIKAAIKATDDAIVAKKNADTATSKANTSASKADVATGKANVATAQADEATAKAIKATTDTLDAIVKAVEATKQAAEATEAAITATGKANESADKANTQAEYAKVEGDKAKALTTDLQKAHEDLTPLKNDVVKATADANAATSDATNAYEKIKGWGAATPYVQGTTYNKNNVVTFNGSTYQAKNDSITQAPPTTSASNDGWILLAQRGVDGEGAVASVDGMLPDADGNVTLNHANKTDVATALNNAKKYTDEKIGSVDFTEIENSIADNTSKINVHEAKKDNPHNVTKSQVGLGSVDNVKQASKEEHDRLAQSVATHLADYVNHVKPFEANVEDIPAKTAFIERMNKKANYIGMNNTTFVNPHGLGDPEQLTTVKDMLLMGVHATGYDDLVESWSKKSYTFDVGGPNERTMTVNTTVSNADLEDYYNIFGGKTGTLAGSGGGQHTQNLLSLVNAPNNNWFIGVVLGAGGTSFAASRNLFDIANLSIEKNEKVMSTDTVFNNPDFSDGLNTWSVYSGKPEVSTEDYFSSPQSLKVFSNGTSSQVRKAVQLIKGDKYYVSAKVKCIRYERGSLGFQVGSENTPVVGVDSVTEDFVTVSHIFEAVSNSAYLFVGSLQSANLDGYVDDFTIVDLTTHYGEGNEPTKEELDKFLWGRIPAKMGAVCVVPIQKPFAYNLDNLTVLFEKNGDAIGFPASLTKIMTSMLLLDNIKDINRRIEIVDSDITRGSGPTFHGGDIITVKDALHCMMLPSSNTIANAVARVVGKKIYVDSEQ